MLGHLLCSRHKNCRIMLDNHHTWNHGLLPGINITSVQATILGRNVLLADKSNTHIAALPQFGNCCSHGMGSWARPTEEEEL